MPDSRTTYSRIGALAQLLQLLEAGRVSLVHGSDLGASAQAAHGNVTVSAVAYGERADVGGIEVYIRRLFAGELGVPEGGACGGELTRDSKWG